MPHDDPWKKKEYHAAYYRANRDRLAEQAAKNYSDSREERLAKANEYRSEHAEELRRYFAVYRATHQSEIKQYQAAYHCKFPNYYKEKYAAEHQRELARAATWRSKNRDKYLDACKRWRDANKAKRRAYDAAHSAENAAKRARREALKRKAKMGDQRAVTAFYLHVRTAPGLRCKWCGRFVSIEERHVDHIIPLVSGGAHSIGNLCCSCSRCNTSKGAKLPEDFLATLKGNQA